jgi:hypothetical protein
MSLSHQLQVCLREMRRLLLQLLFAVLKALADGQVGVGEGRFLLTFALQELIVVCVLILHILVYLLHDFLLVHGECALLALHLTFLGLLIGLEGDLVNLVILGRYRSCLPGLPWLAENKLLLQA